MDEKIKEWAIKLNKIEMKERVGDDSDFPKDVFPVSFEDYCCFTLFLEHKNGDLFEIDLEVKNFWVDFSVISCLLKDEEGNAARDEEIICGHVKWDGCNEIEVSNHF